MFDRFDKKVFIAGKLRCTTAMRIGVGRSTLDVSDTDLPILKGASGKPLLPGSSLKGVLRSALEALLRGAVPESAARRVACDRNIGPCVPDRAPREDENQEAPEKALRHRARLANLCSICATFGAPGQASRAVFRDAYADGDPSIERRDGVAIDRDLGRVSGARKYDFDVVSPGTTFPFTLSIESPEPWQEGLVVVGLDLLAQGMLRVGGMSSRGLGEVALTDPSVSIFDREVALRGAKPELHPWEAYSKSAKDAWLAHWSARCKAVETSC